METARPLQHPRTQRVTQQRRRAAGSAWRGVNSAPCDYPKGPPCIDTYFAVVTRSSEPHQNGSWEEKKPAMCMSYRGAEKFCIELIYEAGFLNSIKKGSF